MTIYKIENTKNGRVYIGQTKNFKQRSGQHISSLKGGYHDSNSLQSDFNIYGNVFKISILFECDDCMADDEERRIITLFKSHNKEHGYNNELGGRQGENKSQFLKEQASKKMIGKMSGEKHPMWGKRGELSPLYNVKKSEQHRLNISKALTGSKRPSGVDHHLYGTKKSEEQKHMDLLAQSSRKEIVLTDLSGNEIGRYLSINQCARENGLPLSSVHRCASGGQKYILKKYISFYV